MRILGLIVLTTVAGLSPLSPVFASDVASHLVSFDFQEINEISVTGSPNLSLDTAVAGQGPTDVTDSSCSYAVTTNGINKRITARIDQDMPDHTTLKVSVAAPAGSGTSSGYVTLTTVAADVVTAIGNVAESNRTVTYKLSATVQAGSFPSDSRTVTLTISD